MAPAGAMIANSTHYVFATNGNGNLGFTDTSFPTATISTIHRGSEVWDSKLAPTTGTQPLHGATIISDGQRRLWALGGIPPDGQTDNRVVPIYAFDPNTATWTCLSYGRDTVTSTYQDTRRGAGAAVLRDCGRLTDSNGIPVPKRCIVLFGGQRLTYSGGNWVDSTYKADARVAWLGDDAVAASDDLATTLGPDSNITLLSRTAWVRPAQANAGDNRRPSFRAGYPGVASADSAGFVVFGGVGGQQTIANAPLLNDLWHLDSRPRDGMVELVHKNPIGKPLVAATTYGWGGTPAKAIDGIYLQRHSVNGVQGNCYHSGNTNRPYLRIDLRQLEQNIARIRVLLRQDCCTDRSNGIRVYASTVASASSFNSAANLANGNTVMCGSSAPAYRTIWDVECPTSTDARYIFIKQTTVQHLVVCEVEVFKQLLWSWKEVPRLENAGRTGTAFLNKEAWFDTGRNVARDGRFAIDGLDSIRNEDNACVENRAATDPVLTIDLGSERDVEKLRVVERVDCSGCGDRMNGMRLYVGNERTAYASNYQCTGVSNTFTNEITINCAARGRFVHVHLPGNNRILQVCELEVMAVKEGWPAARKYHAGVSFRGHGIYFGGVGAAGAVLGDVHALDTTSFVWLQGADALKALGRQPAARLGSVVAAVGDKELWMHGGVLADTTISPETWRLSFTPCQPWSTFNVASSRGVAGVNYLTCSAGSSFAVPASKGGGVLACGLDGQVVGVQPACRAPVPAAPSAVVAAGIPSTGRKDAMFNVTWDASTPSTGITGYRVRAVSPPYSYNFKDQTAASVLQTFTMQPGSGGANNNHDIAVTDDGRLAITTTDSRDCWWFRGDCPVLSHPWPAAISQDSRFGSIVVETKVTMDALGNNKQAGIVTWWGQATANYNDANVGYWDRNRWDVAFLVHQSSSNGLDITVSRSNRESWGATWGSAYNSPNHLPVRTVSLRIALDIREGEYSFSYKPQGDAEWTEINTRFRIWDTFWGDKNWGGDRRFPQFGLMAKSWVTGGGYTAYFHYFRMQTLGCSQSPGHERTLVPLLGGKQWSEIDGLDFDFSYNFQVAAVSANGISRWSTASSAVQVAKASTGQTAQDIVPIRGFASSLCFGSKIERLYDGIPMQNFNPTVAVHTCNGNGQFAQWVALDLGKPHIVTRVKVWDRTDGCCSARSDYAEVRVGNSLTVNDNKQCEGTGTNWAFRNLDCFGLSGRYVFFSNAFWKRWDAVNIGEMTAVGYVDNQAGCPDRSPWTPTNAATDTPPSDKVLYATTSTASECQGNNIDATCNLQCAAGYTLMGGATSSKCDSTGGWNAPAPVCQQPCGQIPLPDGARSCKQFVVNADFSSEEDLQQFDTLRPSFNPRQRFWAVENGLLLAAGQGGVKCSNGGVYLKPVVRGISEVTSAVVLQTRMRTDDSAGVMFRALDFENMYRFRLNMFDETFQLERFLAGDGQTLSEGAFPIPLDKTLFHDIEVKMDGRFLTVRVDSIVFATTADSLLAAGDAGLYALTTAQFEHFAVFKGCDNAGCTAAARGGVCDISCRPGWDVVGTSRLVCTKKGLNEYAWYSQSNMTYADPSTEFGCRIRPPAVGNFRLSIAENSEPSTPVGEPVQGLLEDDLEQLAYKIDSGNDNGTFAIDLCSGQIKVRSPAALDFETRREFRLKVKVYVVDYDYAFSLSDVVITVTDVNEPPIVSTKSVSFDEHPMPGTLLGQIVVNDPEGDAVTFSLDADETNGAVVLDAATGNLNAGNSSVTTLNFEVRARFLIVLTVAETSTADVFATTASVELSLLDANDSPAIQSQQVVVVDELAAAVGVSFDPAVSATDEDLGSFASDVEYTIDAVASVPEYASVAQSSLALGFSEGQDDGSGVATRIFAPTTTRGLSSGGSHLFSIDNTTGVVSIQSLPTGLSAYSRALGDPFFVNSRIAREAYALKVTATDKFGGSTSGFVAVVVAANLTSDPFIEAVGGASTGMSTEGAQLVNFTGRNFGDASNTVYASLEHFTTDGGVQLRQYNATQCRILSNAQVAGRVADSSLPGIGVIECLTPPGSGSGYKWVLYIEQPNGVTNRVRSTLPLDASFAGPAVTRFEGITDLPTAGNAIVRIYGSSFGPAADVVKVTFGPLGKRYRCNDRGVRGSSGSHDYMECTTSEAVGNNLDWTLTVANQVLTSVSASSAGASSTSVVSAVTDRFSHAAATVTRATVSGSVVTSTGLDTAGGQQLTIEGENFGPASVIAENLFTASFGGPSGELLAFQTCFKPAGAAAHKSVTCTTVPWVGTGHLVAVKVGGVQGGAAATGSSFGTNATSNSSSVVISYLPPSVHTVGGAGARGGKTEGGQVVFLTGEHFGPASAAAEINGVFYGPASSPRKYQAMGCTITASPSPSRMECITAEGTGKDHEWTAVIGNQASARNTDPAALSRYGPPVIVQFTDAGAEGASTAGNQLVIISGVNFGPTAVTAAGLLRVMYKTSLKNGPAPKADFHPAACAVTVAHEEIQCRTAEGAGAPLQWDITIDSLESTTPTTSYEVPSVSGLERTLAAAQSGVTKAVLSGLNPDGGEPVFVVGSGFGPSVFNFSGLMAPMLQSVGYGPGGEEYMLAPSEVAVIDHSTLSFTTKPGSGSNLRLVVTVADQASPLSDVMLSYLKPVVHMVTPTLLPTLAPADAPIRLKIHCSNLPLRDPLSTVFVVVGNGIGASAMTVIIPPADQATDSVTGKQVLDVVMPASGLGKDVAVRVGVARAGKAVAAASSFIALEDTQAVTGVDGVSDLPGATATAAIISYKDPVISYLSAKAADHLPAGGMVGSCPFPVGDASWDCNDTSVIQVAVIGTDFGASPSDLVKPDGVSRVVEMLVSFAGVQRWTAETVFVHSWNHDRIVVYTKVAAAKLRVVLTSTGWDNLPRVQSDEEEYLEMAPQISALEGMPADGYPTVGGTRDNALKLTMSGLTGASRTLRVDIGSVPATFYSVDSSGNPLSEIGDGTTPESLQNLQTTVINNPAAQVPSVGGLQQWKVYVKVPRGQGSMVDVTVIRDDTISDVQHIAYREPVVSSVAVVQGRGSPTTATLPTPGTVIRTPTAGGSVVEIRGTDFGVAPHVVLGDSVQRLVASRGGQATDGSLILACDGSGATYSASSAHDCLRVTVPAGEGDGRSLAEHAATGFVLSTVAGDQRAAQRPALHYIPPSVTSVSGSDFPTRGGARITINGNDFGIGRFGFNDTTAGLAVDIGGGPVPRRECTAPVRLSHTAISCVLPEGGGRGLSVAVSVAGISATSPDVVNYDAPIITSIETAVPAAEDALLPARTDTSASATAVAGVMRVGGLTSGDYNLTIRGSNFGSSAAVTCVRLAWANRITSGAGVQPETCNGLEDVLGEGEVAEARVFEVDHEKIVLSVPPGVGRKHIIIDVHGVRAANTRAAELVYDPPTLRVDPTVGFPVLSPASGGTEGGDALSLVGVNFGTSPQNFTGVAVTYESSRDLMGRVLLPNTHYVRVRFHKSCVTDARTAGGSRPQSHNFDDCYPSSPEYRNVVISEHEHNRLTFVSPPGIGVDRNVTVEIVDSVSGEVVSSQPALFSYLPPSVVRADPSVVRFEDASGGPRLVDMRGNNFGNAERMDRDEWTPDERLLAANIGGFPCSTTRRRRENGDTIVACTLEPTIPVGPKNVTVDVVAQIGFRSEQDRVVTIVCDRDYFGQPEELCMACPNGASCLGYRCVEQECPNTCAGCFDETVPASQRPPAAVCNSCPTECGQLTCLGQATTENPCFARVCTHNQPIPEPGFFNLNSTDRFNQDMGSVCPPNSIIPGRDVCITPCSPREACVGENLCAVGYRSAAPFYRCSNCELGFYRRAGLCVKCPDSPELLIIAFCVLALGAAVAAYFLNRMNIDVALLQIGVDYFQVLAIFASARIKWPAIIQDIFHIMSAFNLNLEITAPECLVPDIAFVTKWLIIMGVPVGCCTVLLVTFFSGYGWKRFIKRESHKVSMLVKDKILAGYMILLYFLYLYITKQILDIFNCTPTDPPDGKLYLQAVFEPCDQPGGVHETLLPIAIIALGAYVIGFPAFSAYVTFRNRELIMLDQLLRCYDVGHDKRKFAAKSKEEKAWRFRRAYNRLFYAFRPEFYYWILILLSRKFLIAVASLMFADAPDFQMAFVLFILFINYTLQVYFSPYMSRNRFKSVATGFFARADREKTALAAGRTLASDPSSRLTMHVRVAEEFKAIRAKNEKLARNCGTVGGASATSVSGAVQVSEDDVIGILRNQMFDYNTVATLLLASATLVTLGGIMFESGRLEREGAETSLDAITYVVLIIIFISIAYFVLVLGLEMAFVCNRQRFERRAKARAMSKGAANRTADEQSRLEKEGVQVKGMMANPMMRAGGVGDASAGAGSGSEASPETSTDREVVRARREMDRKLIDSLTDEPPTKDAWMELRERLKESISQVRDLTEVNQSLRRESVSSTMIAMPGAGARHASNRRSFAAASAQGGGRAKGSLKGRGAGPRKNLLASVGKKAASTSE